MAQERLTDLESPDQLLGLFANASLLGVPLDPDNEKVIRSYIQANLEGEEQLKDFSLNVIARIPNVMFEKPIVPGKDIVLGDLIDLSRYAIEVKKWSLGKNMLSRDDLPLGV
jgi:hypothetical protein